MLIWRQGIFVYSQLYNSTQNYFVSFVPQYKVFNQAANSINSHLNKNSLPRVFSIHMAVRQRLERGGLIIAYAAQPVANPMGQLRISSPFFQNKLVKNSVDLSIKSQIQIMSANHFIC